MASLFHSISILWGHRLEKIPVMEGIVFRITRMKGKESTWWSWTHSPLDFLLSCSTDLRSRLRRNKDSRDPKVSEEQEIEKSKADLLLIYNSFHWSWPSAHSCVPLTSRSCPSKATSRLKELQLEPIAKTFTIPWISAHWKEKEGTSIGWDPRELGGCRKLLGSTSNFLILYPLQQKLEVEQLSTSPSLSSLFLSHCLVPHGLFIL